MKTWQECIDNANTAALPRLKLRQRTSWQVASWL